MAARGKEMTAEISVASFFWEKLPCLSCGTVNAYQPGAATQACACGKAISLWDAFAALPPAPDCLENPKHHRHPDWIEQWEDLELRGPITQAGL